MGASWLKRIHKSIEGWPTILNFYELFLFLNNFFLFKQCHKQCIQMPTLSVLERHRITLVYNHH